MPSNEFYGFDDPDFAVHQEEMAEYSFAKREKMALLDKLNVAELRVLLVHYGYAEKGRDARSWSKPEMVESLAEHMLEVEEA